MDGAAPRPPEKERPPGKPATPQSGLKYVGLGLQLAATVGLFTWLGWWLDQRYGWKPWGMACCGLFGIVAGLYHFVKESSR